MVSILSQILFIMHNGLLCKIMLKQHSIQPDFMNIIQFHYNNTMKGKVKGIFREVLDMVEVMTFLFCCKSINTCSKYLYCKREIKIRHLTVTFLVCSRAQPSQI